MCIGYIRTVWHLSFSFSSHSAVCLGKQKISHPVRVQEEQATGDVKRNLVPLDVPRQVAVHIVLQRRAHIAAYTQHGRA
jgi:hypothetical protein